MERDARHLRHESPKDLMDYLLKGLRWVNAEGNFQEDIRLCNGIVAEIGLKLTPRKGEKIIHFEDHFIYPGLINSHDHLEMNLYPRMGNPPYGSYIEWGHDIYRPKESPVLEIQQVDIRDRLLWGGLKNIMSGVTTVVHHNPWHPMLSKKEFPIRVLKKVAWSHSLVFGENITSAFPKDPETPYVIHAAEGTDKTAHNEIDRLQTMGLLRKNTVLVHAIALSARDIDCIMQAGCCIVWCPASNIFMFNRTADIEKLKGNVPLVLGSDSTLTGSAVLLDEMRAAFDTGLAAPMEIFEMVTHWPARVFHLPVPAISPGMKADLLIAPCIHNDYYQNLQCVSVSNVHAVFLDGEPQLIDDSMHESLLLPHIIHIQGVAKRIRMDVRALMGRIERRVPAAILQTNPLWKMIDS